MNFNSSIAPLALAAALLSAAGAADLRAAAAPAEIFSARVVNFERPSGRAPNLFQVRVTRWSTDTERDRLLQTLRNDGQKAFMDELSKLPEAGVIRTPDTAGYVFRYARRIAASTPGADDKLVVLVERPLEFAEFRQGWQTVDYPFTVVELSVNDKGEGSGQLIPAAKLTTKGAPEIGFVAYTANPYLLQSVRREN